MFEVDVGRGAYGKTIIFGLLKRQGMIYTEIMPDCTRATMQVIIRGHIDPGSVINSDRWPGCDGLVDIGFEKNSALTVEQKSLLPVNDTSTGSRVFGAMPRGVWPSSIA